VVENMEEDILGFLFVGEVVNIVQDQDIHHLVEMDEIIGRMAFEGIYKLLGKLLGADVQHRLVGEQLTNLVADGLGQMGFAKTCSTVQHQGIEGSGPWFGSYCETCRPSKAVAVTLHKRIESITRIQLGIHLHLFEAGDDKRILDGLSDVDGHLDFGPALLPGPSGHLNGIGSGFALMVFHHHRVFQTTVMPQDPFDGLVKKVHVMLFQPFVEKLAGNLDGQHIASHFAGHDGFKPSFETLKTDIVLDDAQALQPCLVFVKKNGG